MRDDNVFAEKYDLLRKLGEGGMAEIFLARQRGLGGFQKELVIKRIHRELARNERYVELFLDEARIAANLNHPNIVHIYDIGKAYGTYYIAMEFIHGADLMDICRRGMKEKRFLPIRHAVKIISQVAEGLGFAHSFRDPQGMPLQIVHRDISPSNIIVSFGGLAKLVDFGIAKAATQVHDDSGKVMGKLNYMAPEQIRGEVVDHRSDLFSLGVVLYEITAGRRLFRGSGDELARRILEEPIPPPSIDRPEYPADLEVVVMRLLEKKPENRYQDAQELHQDLEELLEETAGRSGRAYISRYLVELYDLDGVPLDVDEDVFEDSEGEDLDFERPAGGFDDDSDEERQDEVIFASRMPDSFSGPVGSPVSGEHALSGTAHLDAAHSGAAHSGAVHSGASLAGKVQSGPVAARPSSSSSPSASSPSASSLSASSHSASRASTTAPPIPPAPPLMEPRSSTSSSHLAPSTSSPSGAAKAPPFPGTPLPQTRASQEEAPELDPFADLPPLPFGRETSPETPLHDPFSQPTGLVPEGRTASRTWLWVILTAVTVAGAGVLLKVFGVF